MAALVTLDRSRLILPAELLDRPSLRAAHSALHARVQSGELPFLRLHEDTATADRVAAFAAEARGRFDDCLVLGIGGSSLGGRALVAALGGAGLRVHFPDNVDPERFGDLLASLDLARTLVNVVTKSGGTAETVAQLLVVRERMLRSLGEARTRERIVVTTDPERGFLRTLARDEVLTAFDVPPGVGGRFSALTPVGLLPAALAGVDPHELLAGAAWAASMCASPDPGENLALAAAASLHALDAEGGRPILVTVPYADALGPLGEWFAQLWAESLGKDGRGPTPVTAVGATCQHSQLQLWMEGPPNTVVAFVEVEAFRRDLAIPAAGLERHPEVALLAGHTLGHLLVTEKRATEQALTDAGRPNLTWRLPSVNARSLAALMVLWEAMTAYAGSLYGVDPFDQPGVEAGKIIMKRLLVQS